MNSKLLVAALAALGIAAQAAVLHVAVAAPLASAVHDAAEPVRPTFEESILVRAVAKRPAPPVVHVRG
jgi:hypothetical protein